MNFDKLDYIIPPHYSLKLNEFIENLLFIRYTNKVIELIKDLHLKKPHL